MRHYELVVVFSPTVSEEDVSQARERAEQLVTNNGGEITKNEQWGVRRLAYPIRKSGQTFLEGNYFLTRFSTDTVYPSELEEHLRISESVLRYLIVRTATAVPPEPPPPRFVPRAQTPVADKTAASEGKIIAEAPQDEPAAAPTKVGEPASSIAEIPSEEAATTEPISETPLEDAVTGEVEEPAIAEAPEAKPKPETEAKEPVPTLAEKAVTEEKSTKAKKPRAKSTTTKASKTKTKVSSAAKTTKTKAPESLKSSDGEESEE